MKRINLKRCFDKLLSKGSGQQLLWLLGLVLLIFVAATLVLVFWFDDDILSYKDVIAFFLDPGYDIEPGDHFWFRIIMGTLSLFIFSALLVSVFTNVFENISEAVHEGGRRYRLKGHVIVFGCGENASHVVDALVAKGKTVVVMSQSDPGFGDKVIFYCGSQESAEDVASARPTLADAIYILGDGDDATLDERNLVTLGILQSLCVGGGRGIHCFISLKKRLSSEVFQYRRKAGDASLDLKVDFVDEYEYQAEQLLLDTDFLPVIKSQDSRRAHFVVVGTGEMALAMAHQLAHVCHYPGFPESGKRTLITMLGEGMRACMDGMVSARPALFALSHYGYVSPDGDVSSFAPEAGNDFLDVEWNFVDAPCCSPLARGILEAAAGAGDEMRVIVCDECAQSASLNVLHLPRCVYDAARVAVYLNDSRSIVDAAAETGMFGKVYVFGYSNEEISDPLMERRLTLGKRVNRVYDNAYGNPPAKDEDDAWYRISEADKQSSIHCAQALPLRCKCFDLGAERMPVYEAEHRRWMMSELLMGFRPGPNKDKAKFIHSDIVPFDALPDGEKDKDKILIDALEEICAR